MDISFEFRQSMSEWNVFARFSGAMPPHTGHAKKDRDLFLYSGSLIECTAVMLSCEKLFIRIEEMHEIPGTID